MYFCMKIAIFIARLFQNSHKNVSIVKACKQFLHENYPIASVYLKYLFFILKNGSFYNFYIKNGNF